MSKNYYKILHIERSASEFEISNSYRRLSIQWHPNKNRDNIVAANHMFHQIAEAFEVLIDPCKRAIYDQVGEFGLKEGVPTAQDSTEHYEYQNNAEAIFDEFFSRTNPFFDEYQGAQPGSIFGMGALGQEAPDGQPPADVEISIKCTLEELYNGCTKSVKYQRKKLNSDKTSFSSFEESKEISVRRGTLDKLIYYGQGHESIKFANSDLVIHVEEIPHPSFRRQGDDLFHTAKISLLQALISEPLDIVFFI